MRSIRIFGVATVALSLGIGGALAATPASNFQAGTLDLKTLFPAQANSSVPGLSHIAGGKNAAGPGGLTSRSNADVTVRVSNLRATGLAMRFVASDRTAAANQGAVNALRKLVSTGSKGLAGLNEAAGLPKAASPAVQRLAAAAAKPRSDDAVKLLASLSSR